MVLGTYRLDGSGFTATIVVKAGGIWEYKFDNAHAFQRSGPWSRLQTADSPSTLALQLDNFVFGFEFRPYPRLDAPTTYVMNLEKDPSGHISACLTEDNLFCFKKQ
jgi:hypothetical protein